MLFVPVARQQNIACQTGAFKLTFYSSKCCYGNNNVKVLLHSLLFDINNVYLFSVTEKKPTDPGLKKI